VSNRHYGKPTFVYKAISESGEVLYVGIAVNIKRRMQHHKYCSEWFKEWVRMETMMFQDRWLAMIEESKVIKNDKPKYNQHPGCNLFLSHQHFAYLKKRPVFL
jgi:excinuclease UvrABC nuclease subunit